MMFCAVFPQFDLHRDGMMFQIQNSCCYFEADFVMILVSNYPQSKTHYYFGANVADQYSKMSILANESGHHNVTSCLKHQGDIRLSGHRHDNCYVNSWHYLPFLSNESGHRNVTYYLKNRDDVWQSGHRGDNRYVTSWYSLEVCDDGAVAVLILRMSDKKYFCCSIIRECEIMNYSQVILSQLCTRSCFSRS